MNTLHRTTIALAAGLLSCPVWAEITFYEHDGYRGRSFTIAEPMRDFRSAGFSDRASSAVVKGGRWEVCEDVAYGGSCVVLRPGSYASLGAMSLNDQLSSARPSDPAPAPAPAPAPQPAGHQITFYENDGYQGRSFTTNGPLRDFRGTALSDRASSVVVQGGRWEVCSDVAYGGSCAVLRPGNYPSLNGTGLNDRLSSARPTEPRRGDPVEVPAPVATVPGPQITFYENDGYGGRSFTTAQAVQDFRSAGFNDRASSAVVQGGQWEVCGNTGYGGSCVVLRPGSYSSLGGMGLNDQLSSARPTNTRRAGVIDAPEPMAAPNYPYRRRPNERLFEVPVSSVRAIVGAPTERCWIEQQQATNSNNGNQAGRALLGAVIGGVIGHQIGGGTGRDLATAGGVVTGAVLGARTGRDAEGSPAQDVRRCSSVPSTVPAYWDVGYSFQGVPHQVQLSSAPGQTITVNRFGEPRQ